MMTAAASVSGGRNPDPTQLLLLLHWLLLLKWNAESRIQLLLQFK